MSIGLASSLDTVAELELLQVGAILLMGRLKHIFGTGLNKLLTLESVVAGIWIVIFASSAILKLSQVSPSYRLRLSLSLRAANRNRAFWWNCIVLG